MKKLVRLVAPSNYVHKGKEVYINPDDVVSVSIRDDAVRVQLRDGTFAYDDNCISKVVADIEAAL